MLFSTYTYSKKTAVLCGFCFLKYKKEFDIKKKEKNYLSIKEKGKKKCLILKKFCLSLRLL